MRIPFDLPKHHQADFEELVYQLRGYGADFVAEKLRWERTEDDWALRGPWTTNQGGYQRVGVAVPKYARLREVCGVTMKVYLHRLISAMMYPTPISKADDNSNDPTVHHIDEDKLNCAPANLTIITGAENINESRPYGVGFCQQHGHPIVGKNVQPRGDGGVQCRFCGQERARHRAYRVGRTKTLNPMSPFWLWMMEQYADAPDPELAMMHDTGLLVPVIV